ncbi:APC family permease [Paeniglutamicibacter sp. ABSL32-1]|uniref:APC family permease n=1 Tax=Paeniglutamicibacter quisquiliarum TaxID=2849498 RepID=UPI001C2D41A9|nr:APC family permease [Paeniglutamicibacter quisquiliarum]MBV1778942.1 APC family permease [Paeniglutamicibacter quisquiliarum]
MNTKVSAHVPAVGSIHGSRPTELKRVLGIPFLVLFGLTYMAPVTVFTTYGVVTGVTNGHLPAAYIVGLVTMLFTAFSYAQMSRAVPQAGSAYAYTQQAFGGTVGFATGWTLMLDYLFIPMINFLLIGIYLNTQFPAVPAWAFSLVSLVLVLGLNIIGIKFIGRLSATVVASSVLMIGVFVALVLNQVLNADAPSLLAPFSFGADGLGPIFSGAAILSLSFLGFDAISTLSEDARNPGKTIPAAIVLTTLAGGLIFIVVGWAGALIHPDHTTFADPDAAGVELMAGVGGSVLTAIFVAVYVVGSFGSAMASQASVTRILYSMGRDGLLPRRMGMLNRRFSTPVYATLVVSAVSLTYLFVSLETAASVVSFGALVAFSMVNLSVIKTFFMDAKSRGARSVLLYLLMPLVGFALTIWLWTSLSGVSLVVGLMWFAAGIGFLAIRTKGFRTTPPKLSFED